jgi:catechol 2,3-dioxygenase-like lactoylglutathione lyase family enzyme
MIKGVHTMFYSAKADELRAFLRDVMGFSATDVGGGWLIFDLPEADMGVHPTGEGAAANGTHDISFYCDDIHATVAEMKGKGVEFVTEVSDQGFGLVCRFVMPGPIEVQLYQPKYDK